MNIHPSNKNEVAWTSWLPALGFALARSSGPVLEVGIGHFSTPFLHEYCKGSGRLLVSVETDKEWTDQFKHLGRYSHHAFTSRLPETPEGKKWGVVFIDNSPGGEARLEPFLKYIKNSEYVVVHDYHRENRAAIDPHLIAMYHKIYADYDPPTLIASKFSDF